MTFVRRAWGRRTSARSATWIEGALAALVALSAIGAGVRLWLQGNLPPPFQNDPSQSTMDFFNPAYWAHHAGAYDVWHTVYPPMAFVFLRLFTKQACYDGGPLAGRACDGSALWVMAGFYCVNVVLVCLALRRRAPRMAIPRSVALCVGAPMLYGLELANLILPAFTAFLLGAGPFLRQRWLRQLCLGVAYNFKPYLLATVLAPFLRRRWRWLLGLTIASLIVYLATWALQGDGSPLRLFINFLRYSENAAGEYAGANQLSGAAGALRNWVLVYGLPLRAGQGAAILALAYALFNPASANPRLLTILGFTIISTEAAWKTHGYSADYTLIFLLFFLFSETRRDRMPTLALICGYILCLNLDAIWTVTSQAPVKSYLTSRVVWAQYGPTIGQFVRPAVLLALQFAVAAMVLGGALHKRPAPARFLT